MCLDVRKTCECGAKTIQFNLRNNVMEPGVIARLFCPSCPGNVSFDSRRMINDNGWIIEYDIDLALRLAMSKLVIEPELMSPEFLFDEGYACWLEMYPGEQREIKEDKEEIIKLLQENQKKISAGHAKLEYKQD